MNSKQESGGKLAANSALSKQVGGSHYQGSSIQPIEFIHANGLSFTEGSAIKYICRHKRKNGAEDIRKAIHYLEILLEQEYAKDENKRFRSWVRSFGRMLGVWRQSK